MEIRNLLHKAGSKWPTYGIQRKNKRQILRNSRENNAREYTLDWSQSKVFLVYNRLMQTKKTENIGEDAFEPPDSMTQPMPATTKMNYSTVSTPVLLFNCSSPLSFLK